MSKYRPIAATLIAASATYGLFLVVDAAALASEPLVPSLLLWFVAGLVYAQLTEFWVHLVPMHRGLPLLAGVRRSHLEHHRIFHGDRFRTRDPQALEHVAGRWWAFPLLLLGHYALLRPLLGTGPASAFFLAAVLHYLVFETTHWLTHLDDNGFDRFVAGLPWIATVRARQIEHHRRHHEVPLYAFNFNPPYLGDRLTGRMPRPEPEDEEPVLAPPAPAPVPELAVRAPTPRWRPWLRPVLGYGSAIAVGVALVGLAVVAHGRWSESRAPAVLRDRVG